MSAGGTTLYELCAYGIPTVVFLMADNQQYAYSEMTKEIMLPGGNALADREECVSTLTRQVHSLLGVLTNRQMLSCRMKSLVSGKGAYAIINRLLSFSTALHKRRLCHALMEYVEYTIQGHA